MSRPAAVLDRDGTLNVRPPAHEYVTRVQDFRWLPGAQEAVARLAGAGYVLAVASNQRGVARGLVSEDVLSGIEERIQADLARHGCRIEAFRYCRHDHADACACRKPGPGLLHELTDLLDLDPAASWMIGDAASDVGAGRAAGFRTALVGPEAVVQGAADVVAPSLLDAAERIAGGAGYRAAPEANSCTSS